MKVCDLIEILNKKDKDTILKVFMLGTNKELYIDRVTDFGYVVLHLVKERPND